MDLLDINALLQQYKREFLMHAFQEQKSDFENFCKQAQLIIQLPRKNDFHFFSDYQIKTKNRDSNQYEIIDWSQMKDASFIAQYDFQDTIQETTLEKLCGHTLQQLGYIIATAISPLQEAPPVIASAQTFQKSCASIKSILNHTGKNLEYTTTKNYINFVIQKFISCSNEVNGKITLGEILKIKGLDKLYIGFV